MSEVKWELNYKYHMNISTRASPYFTKHEEEKTKKEWQEYYQQFADKINAEGGSIQAYIVEGGFKLNPKLEGISDELKQEIQEAGLRI